MSPSSSTVANRPILFEALASHDAALVTRREPKGEHASVADRALDCDPAVLELSEQSRDGETESGAAQFPAARLVDPEKAVEDQLEMLRRDPGSGVLHGHADHVPVVQY